MERIFPANEFGWQELDNKTIQRIEKAVAKSEYSQGKKLKVVTKVGFILYACIV